MLPPYETFPVLISDKILLRQILESDLKHILEIQFYDGKVASTETEGKIILNRIHQDYIDGNSIHWGIEDRATGKHTGTLGYYRGFKNNTGELGCILLSAFRKQGFMSMALKLAVEFGITHMQLTRIIAITTTENTSAIKLLERLGFTLSVHLEDCEVEFEFRKK